jgi:hypothetical protein
MDGEWRMESEKGKRMFDVYELGINKCMNAALYVGACSLSVVKSFTIYSLCSYRSTV